MCIGVNGHSLATVTHCQRSGTWSYDPKTKLMKHSKRGKCLAVDYSGDRALPKLLTCDKSNEYQHWEFTRYKKTGIRYQDLK